MKATKLSKGTTWHFPSDKSCWEVFLPNPRRNSAMNLYSSWPPSTKSVLSDFNKRHRNASASRLIFILFLTLPRSGKHKWIATLCSQRPPRLLNSLWKSVCFSSSSSFWWSCLRISNSRASTGNESNCASTSPLEPRRTTALSICPKRVVEVPRGPRPPAVQNVEVLPKNAVAIPEGSRWGWSDCPLRRTSWSVDTRRFPCWWSAPQRKRSECQVVWACPPAVRWCDGHALPTWVCWSCLFFVFFLNFFRLIGLCLRFFFCLSSRCLVFAFWEPKTRLWELKTQSWEKWTCRKGKHQSGNWKHLTHDFIFPNHGKPLRELKTPNPWLS